ncbi:MAG: imidazole glycerol phosphate synthase subunit HisH [Mariprofundaceae bacterium]
MKKTGLINYGMDNLHSVAKALEKTGSNVELVDDAESLLNYDRIVLPGVGAFRDCATALKDSGMDAALKETVAAGTPFLGICLGMQILMDVSYEFGRYSGLGIIPGSVKHFPEDHPERGFKIPHMGWNDVIFSSAREEHPVLAPLRDQQVYYVHSYCCHPVNPDHLLAACSYGDHPFTAAIGHDNVIAVQFHPEKSQRAGLAMLEAFQQWKP